MTILQIRQKMIDQGVDRVDVGDIDIVGAIDHPTKLPVFSDNTIVDIQVFLKRLGFDTTLGRMVRPKEFGGCPVNLWRPLGRVLRNPEDALALAGEQEAEVTRTSAFPKPQEPTGTVELNVTPIDPESNNLPTKTEAEGPYEIPGIPFWHQ